MRVTWKEANHLDAAIIAQGQDHPLAHGWIDADKDLRVGEIIEDSNCRVQLENRIRLCREDGL